MGNTECSYVLQYGNQNTYKIPFYVKTVPTVIVWIEHIHSLPFHEIMCWLQYPPITPKDMGHIILIGTYNVIKLVEH